MPPLGWLILAAALLLSGFGLAAIFAGEAGSGLRAAGTMRQAAFLAAGLVGFIVIQWPGYRRIGDWANILFVITLALLALLVLAHKVPMQPFIVPRRDVYRWIVIGPVNIQVSELAKIIYVLALASYLRFRTNYRTLRGLLPPFILTLVPTALILKEPDLGTSLLLLPTLFVMLFVAGAKIRHLLLFVFLGAVAAPVFYFSPFMHDYQRARIRSILRQDEPDKRWRMNEGYQLSQSKIAMGSGGLAGQGFRGGAFFRHDLLPEGHNDFIFAVIGHQWGFLGCLLVLLCYLTIVVAGLTIASMTTEPLGRLLAVGICALLTAQTLTNIGMTVGLVPITGMTLPFASMGGSSLIISYMTLGLLVDIGRRRPLSMARRPFEFDYEEEE